MDIEKLKHKYPATPITQPSAAQPAGKHFDIVMGVDIHLVILPPATAPVPMPHIHVGMVFDIVDLLPPITIPVPRGFAEALGGAMEKVAPLMGNMFGAGESSAFHKAKEATDLPPEPEEAPQEDPPATVPLPIGMGSSVFVNSVRRSQIGTQSIVLPFHIPMGAAFSAPPMVKHEGKSFMGSKTVMVEGMPFTYNALPFMSCSCIGMAFCPETKKPTKPGMFLPTATILPLPLGKPVNIGGPPTIFMSPLGAMFKGFKFFRKWQKSSKFWKKISEKLHGKGVNSFISKLICLATGHPVDVADGKLFTDWVDFELAGPLPIEWERTYYSASSYQGPIGTGWHHSYDICIEDDRERDCLVLRNQEGRHIALPRILPGEYYYDRAEKYHFFYDEEGYVLRLASGLEWRFFPKNEGVYRLKEIRNEGGHSLHFQYDSQGHLGSIIDPAGRRLRIENDSKGRITKVFGPHPEIPKQEDCWVTYEYDQEGRLIAAIDALDQAMRFQYEGTLMVKEIWRNGLSFHFRYDGTDYTARCVHTWGDGGIYNHKLKFDDKQGFTEVTNSVGNLTRYYHRGGLVHRIVESNGAESFTEYNEFNEILTETDALGRTTAYNYDLYGNQVGIITPTGGKISMLYDDRNRLIEAKDINGEDWQWEYRENGLLQKLTSPTATTEYQYENGLPVKILENGIITEINWDTHLNPIRIATDTQSQEFLYFDQRGRLLEKRDDRNNRTEYRYDTLDRVLEVKNPDGRVEQFDYDAQDNVIRARDGRKDIRYAYTGMQRMTAREENGLRVEFNYNTEENLVSIKNEKGSMYRFRFDDQGNVATEAGFGGLVRNYHRDIMGRVTEVKAPGEKKTQYHYDGGDRVSLIEHFDGTRESFTYGEDGRLLEAANEHTLIRFEYDKAGRVKRESRDGFEVNSYYNSKGERTWIKSSLGADIRIGYDAYGDVTSMLAKNGHGSWETKIARDNLGFEIERKLPGGIIAHWQRDRLGRPIALGIRNTAGKLLRQREYSWKGEDQITGISDFTKSYSVRYHHDVWGNLVHAQYGTGEQDIRHTDETGNLYRTFDASDRKYGPAGELLQCKDFTYEYDQEGFLIEKVDRKTFGCWKYTWNATGMLSEVLRPDGKAVKMEYDPLGRRIAKHFDGKVTRWVWDGNLMLHEWASDSEVSQLQSRPDGKLESVAPNDLVTWVFEEGTFSPAARMQGSDRLSIVCDHLGTPNQAYDAEGRRVWECELDIYGKVRSLQRDRSLIPFRFPGQYEDVETGLYYNRFRYYSPDSGGYLSQDPIGLAGGNPNDFAYVRNTNLWVDFLGLAEMYHLVASKSGTYRVEEWGVQNPTKTVKLKKGEIWKIGETKNPKTRYSQSWLASNNLSYKKVTNGWNPKSRMRVRERNAIDKYVKRWGKLPPGNKCRH